MIGFDSFCLRKLLLIIILSLSLPCFGQNSQTSTVIVHYTNSPANTFIPSKSLGVGYDGHEKGDNDKILTNLPQMFSVNMKPLTYRLRTELGMEVWHWNPKGKWSE